MARKKALEVEFFLIDDAPEDKAMLLVEDDKLSPSAKKAVARAGFEQEDAYWIRNVKELQDGASAQECLGEKIVKEIEEAGFAATYSEASYSDFFTSFDSEKFISVAEFAHLGSNLCDLEEQIDHFIEVIDMDEDDDDDEDEDEFDEESSVKVIDADDLDSDEDDEDEDEDDEEDEEDEDDEDDCCGLPSAANEVPASRSEFLILRAQTGVVEAKLNHLVELVSVGETEEEEEELDYVPRESFDRLSRRISELTERFNLLLKHIIDDQQVEDDE